MQSHKKSRIDKKDDSKKLRKGVVYLDFLSTELGDYQLSQKKQYMREVEYERRGRDLYQSNSNIYERVKDVKELKKLKNKEEWKNIRLRNGIDNNDRYTLRYLEDERIKKKVYYEIKKCANKKKNEREKIFYYKRVEK